LLAKAANYFQKSKKTAPGPISAGKSVTADRDLVIERGPGLCPVILGSARAIRWSQHWQKPADCFEHLAALGETRPFKPAFVKVASDGCAAGGGNFGDLE